MTYKKFQANSLEIIPDNIERSDSMNNLDNIYNEIEKHLLEDEKPSDYLNALFKEKNIAYQHPFTMVNILKKIEQSPKHHPEGSVWNHTMLVTDYAASKKQQSSDPKIFMWSAFLHDIGKASTTKKKNGRITAYDHDKHGGQLVNEFLSSFNVPKDFIKKVSQMVRWHMQILYVVKDLPFANIKQMLSELELDDIALLSLCDRLGRGHISDETIAHEEKNVELFIEKCKNCIME